MTASPYSPIADYAMIGCTRSAALVSRGGSIDWLCWPRFDSPSLFARILDYGKGGFFEIKPAVPFTATRRYDGDTNILETTFTTERGVARLTDLMPVLTEEEKRHRLTPSRQLMRRIETLEGEVPIEVTYAPRPAYASYVPRLERRDHAIVVIWGPRIVHLRSDVALTIDGGTAVAAFTLPRGASHTFALGYDDRTPAVFARLDASQIDETRTYWQKWSSAFSYKGPYRDAVMRSALTLKLLSYAPSGGIVAALTTSLPEAMGGIRNWDYRYCWLRDASFTMRGLYDCGFDREGAAFLDWLIYSTRLTQPRLQVLYDVFGEARLPERELPHLEGYRGAKPVRIGNDAHDQFQLDVYGEVLGAVEEAATRGESIPRDVQRMLKRIADLVCRRWREPDSGIWEKRGDRQQHIHAKVMAWSALDCAERLVAHGKMKVDVSRWKTTKEEIRQYVLTEGFDREMNSFVAVAGEAEVDASLLYVVRVGFLKPDDPRVLGTIQAVRDRLAVGDLLYRYDSRATKDGLPPGEGAFLACSFWLVEALALADRNDEARELFERVLKRSNDVGLYSEEMDPKSGEMLGNFPQALTHIAMINAALCMEKEAPRKGASQRKV